MVIKQFIFKSPKFKNKFLKFRIHFLKPLKHQRLYSNQPIFEDSPFLHRSISQPPSLHTPQEIFQKKTQTLQKIKYTFLNWEKLDSR